MLLYQIIYLFIFWIVEREGEVNTEKRKEKENL